MSFNTVMSLSPQLCILIRTSWNSIKEIFSQNLQFSFKELLMILQPYISLPLGCESWINTLALLCMFIHLRILWSLCDGLVPSRFKVINWTNACLKILKIWKIAKINQNLKISYLKIETFQVEIGKHISWGQSRWDFKLSIFWKISFANKLIHQPNLFEL